MAEPNPYQSPEENEEPKRRLAVIRWRLLVCGAIIWSSVIGFLFLTFLIGMLSSPGMD